MADLSTHVVEEEWLAHLVFELASGWHGLELN